MTHPIASEGASGSHLPGQAAASPVAGGPGPFSPGELATFHTEDRTTAKHIVGLMLTIFVLGVAGYLVVCYWVS